MALHARTADGVVALERELGRPVWDHVLEQLASRKEQPKRERTEWAFSLAPVYQPDDYRLVPFSRRILASGKPAMPDFRDAYHTQLVFDAVLASAKGHSWLDVQQG